MLNPSITFRNAFTPIRVGSEPSAGWRRRRGLPGACLASMLLAGLTASALADVRVPGLFTDNMVLQQGMAVPVWGWADEGEVVTVQFRNQTASVKARGGKWMLRLKALKPGGPDPLTIAGRNHLEIKNVLVGEVWVCSGQSNMEWPMSRSFEPQSDIAAAANGNLRLFTVPKLRALEPTNDVPAVWRECGPETVPGFSAVAYYFGRALQRDRQVPVGLIHTSWGGSPAEVWMSEAVLKGDKEYKRDIFDAYGESESNYLKAKEQAARDGKPAPWPPWRPTELYNGMIAPLIPYAIKGAIWYQGESNAPRAFQYRRLFADMIRNWRRDWGQGDFAFLAVQLAPWDRNRKRTLEQITETPVESDWAELREAQMIVARTLKNVGVAVITDVGDKDDIHPARKGPVGERLAAAARRVAYGDQIAWAGPAFKSVSFSKGSAIISFDHVGQGLEARGGVLQGFSVAGADRKFYWATAEVQGAKVAASSPNVPAPVAVRYGWADYPVVNLWNQDGFPASPFRSDDFPMLSGPKPPAGQEKRAK
jgi:sialate O-acetylesterase